MLVRHRIRLLTQIKNKRATMYRLEMTWIQVS